MAIKKGVAGVELSGIVRTVSKKKEETWPREITSGNVTVKVYRQKAPRSKSGLEYVVAWRGASGRERKPFTDLSTALDEAKLKAEKLDAGQIEAAGMGREDRDELTCAREIAGGVPLVAALQEWARARELTSGAILPAAEAWAKRHATDFTRRHAAKVVEEFIKYKTSRGKKGERTYGSKLRPIKTAFPERYLDDISTLEWSQYFGRWKDGVTQNDFRKRAVEMCKWARDVAGYLPRAVPTAVELTERARERGTDIGILTPAVWKEVLEWIRKHHPEHLAAVVVAGFCGVRSDEIHGKRDDRKLGDDCPRQTWEDIDLAQKHLNVSNAKENTPAWRLVPICDAAIEWLRLCPGDHKGPVCVPGAMEKARWVLLNVAKISLPENCFRHSFISYEIAVSGDKAKVATWAGNSVKEIDKRYRRPALPATGKAWFAVQP